MPHGKTLLCCYIQKSPGVLEDDNLLEIYNSPTAQKIRASILDNTFRYCNLEACPHFSAGSLPLQKDCLGTQYEDIIRKQSPSVKDLNIWLSFDQRCNLRCISCRAKQVHYSTQEKDETKKLLKQIKSALPQIKNLGLNGSGDPFASKTFRLFLAELDATQFPRLQIYILTNGILLNQQIWDEIHKATPAITSIQVSIDAANKTTYEKIRRGGSYNILLSNLQFISKLRRNNHIKEFIISFVVNAHNYKEMVKFISLGKALNCDQVYFSAIMDWGVLPHKKYLQLAVHLPNNPCHQDFKNQLYHNAFNDSIVCLGNLHKFKPNILLRDSLFS